MLSATKKLIDASSKRNANITRNIFYLPSQRRQQQRQQQKQNECSYSDNTSIKCQKKKKFPTLVPSCGKHWFDISKIELGCGGN